MKFNNIFKYSCMIVLIGFMISSCKKKDPSIDNYFLNYTIPEVPVTSDYTVGAFYYANTVFNANIKYTPLAGKYVVVNTTGIAPAVIQMHIDQAVAAKIDYFIFSMRSPTLDFNNYRIDSIMLNSFLNAPNASKMNFAISYNMTTGTLGISNSGNPDAAGNARGTPIEANATKLEGFYKDFQRLGFYLGKSNYQKINGKWLIIMNHAQDLNSSMDPSNPGSTAPLYAEVRRRLNLMGFDLYIIGEQDNWSVPNNYFFRYQNSVDAVYEANMADNKGFLDRNYVFATMCDQNFAYWKKELESWPAGGLTPGAKNLEFVPCIQAAYNYQITSTASTNLSVGRTADGAFYRTYTNIAKRNASASKLVLVDSFNNFQVDTQIEPTQEYGTLYMDITRQEFKVN
jgi:hypothetical protein